MVVWLSKYVKIVLLAVYFVLHESKYQILGQSMTAVI